MFPPSPVQHPSGQPPPKLCHRLLWASALVSPGVAGDAVAGSRSPGEGEQPFLPLCQAEPLSPALSQPGR